MSSILHEAFSDAFDIFLGWLVIHYAYQWGLAYVEITTKERYADIPLLEKLLGFGLWLLIPAIIATGIFFLRTMGKDITGGDYSYCITAFLIIWVPAYVGLYKAYDEV